MIDTQPAPPVPPARRVPSEATATRTCRRGAVIGLVAPTAMLACVVMLALMLSIAPGCASGPDNGGLGNGSLTGFAKIHLLKKQQELEPALDWTIFTYNHPQYESFRVGDATTSDIIPGYDQANNDEALELARSDMGYDFVGMREALSGDFSVVEADVSEALLMQFDDLGFFNRYGLAARSLEQVKQEFYGARTSNGIEKYKNCIIVDYDGEFTVLFPPVSETGGPIDSAHFRCYELCTRAYQAVWNAYHQPTVTIDRSGGDPLAPFRNDAERLNNLADRDREAANNRPNQ